MAGQHWGHTQVPVNPAAEVLKVVVKLKWLFVKIIFYAVTVWKSKLKIWFAVL